MCLVAGFSFKSASITTILNRPYYLHALTYVVLARLDGIDSLDGLEFVRPRLV
jgi:hypothetical protein